ncbi:Uncharacterised protein [Mycobacteroides abscessus subsp. abscessus]|nr:Uncharacterised protein [Mycobacteroides abscessus subsp. abscessus]
MHHPVDQEIPLDEGVLGDLHRRVVVGLVVVAADRLQHDR